MSLAKATLTFFVNENDTVVVDDKVAHNKRIGYTGITDCLSKVKDTITSPSTWLKAVPNVQTNDGDTVYFQFNPSTISISAIGGGKHAISRFGSGEKSLSYSGFDNPYIEVSFKAIFDAERNTDAFVSDKLNVESAAKGIVKGATDLFSKVYSVRPIVEGFIASIRSNEFKKVVFAWGYQRYNGVVNRVGCTYTMFNLSGEPIRAEVTIGIRCSENANIEAWRKKYKQVLIDNAISETSNVSNYVNNILNFQL